MVIIVVSKMQTFSIAMKMSMLNSKIQKILEIKHKKKICLILNVNWIDHSIKS